MYREETSIENIDTNVVKDSRVKEYGVYYCKKNIELYHCI